MKQIAALFAALLATTGGTAQTPVRRVSIGLQAGYNFNDLNKPAVGGHLLVGLPAGLAFYPAAQGYFVRSGSLWRASATLRWAPPTRAVTPYVAVGPYWSKRSGAGAQTVESGVISQFGTEGTLNRIRPFAELQFLLGAAFSSEFSCGARVTIGRWGV